MQQMINRQCFAWCCCNKLHTTCNDYKCAKLFLLKFNYCSRCSSILLSTRCKTFYGELVEFMSRGAIAAILEKTTLLKIWTLIVLLTSWMLLKVQSVKHMLLYWENAVHGSDSDENAAIEGAFHFCRKRAV
jgi:nucleoside diphosphate kinase